MWELDYKETWVLKNWCFWTVVLEKTLESPMDSRRLNQAVLKEISPEYSWEGLMLKLKPLLWPPDAKNRLIGKDPDAGKDWRQEEKGMTDDEMVRWHHWLNGHEFEQAPGVGDGQGSLACCSPWGCKESDKTEQLNWTGGGLVTKLCSTRCNPMDYSAPGYLLLQGIFQIQGSNLCLLPGRQIHYHWVTWEAHHQIRWFQSTDDNLKRYYPGFLSLPSYGGLDTLLKECLLIFSFI